MVTTDEIPDPSRLTLVGRLNKAEMQRATTDLLIFDIPALIAYITTFTELVPGDVISTGTPGGVGSKRQPPVWLKAGRRVRGGDLRHRRAAEPGGRRVPLTAPGLQTDALRLARSVRRPARVTGTCSHRWARLTPLWARNPPCPWGVPGGSAVADIPEA